jgi:ferredoxin
MRTVTFLPSYHKIDVARGSTILDAAQRAGININVVCGGQGKCGKCIVYVQSGKTEFDRQKYSRFFSDDDLARGACLACETTVQGDLRVFIPESTLIQEQKILVEGRDTEIELHPSVKKYYVELQPPTLTDPSPDLSRLLWGIQKSGGPLAEKIYVPLEVMREIYRTLYLIETPIVATDIRTAEMIKYASNAFLATRISFINEIANICDELGADVTEVARGMGLDKRIGHSFLDAGLGWGGSCFPKDVKALAHMAVLHGTQPQLLQAVMDINRNQRRRAVVKLRKALGGLNDKTIGILGLSFKPNTDDIREAPALEIIHLLMNEGANIQAYDPQAMPGVAKIMPAIKLCSDPYQVAEKADALVLATEWNEFKQLDFERIREIMNGLVVLDGRNLWDPDTLRGMGFTYFGVGRGTIINGNNDADGK